MFQQEGNWFHMEARLLELSFFVKNFLDGQTRKEGGITTKQYSIPHQNVPNSTTVDTNVQYNAIYFRFTIPLEIQLHLFSQCFPQFFWLKIHKETSLQAHMS